MKKGKSRMSVVYRNYRTPVGELRGNPFKTKPEIPKKVSSC